MNLLLVDDTDYIAPNTVAIRGRRCEHLSDTLGVKVADTVRVGKMGGNTGVGKVAHIEKGLITLEVELNQQAPAPLPLTLVLALPRPKMLKRCLRMAAETGIKEIHLINSSKVEKSYWQSPLLNDRNKNHQGIDDYLRSGLEQAMDTVLPTVEQHRLFRPFVEDHFPGIIQGKSAWVAHPRSVSGPNRSGFLSAQRPLVICVGPEGGFTEYEVSSLSQQGARPLDFGSRIYRVETFLPMLAGLLCAAQTADPIA